MIQVTPHMRVLVAVEPADFRKGIDGLARVCKGALGRDPFGADAPRYARRTVERALVRTGLRGARCMT